MLASAPFYRVSVGLCLSVSIPYTFSSLSHDKGLKKSVLAFCMGICGWVHSEFVELTIIILKRVRRVSAYWRGREITGQNQKNIVYFCIPRREIAIPRRETAIPRRGIAISRRGTDFSSTFLEFMYYMKRICSKYSRARFPARLPCHTSYQVDMVIP